MAGTAPGGPPYGGAQSESGGVREQAQQKAQDVKEQAREQAQQAAGQARRTFRDQVDERSTQAGEQVTRQASDIRSVSEQLRQQGKDGPARVVDQVAQRTESVGNWLTQSDGDRILQDIEDFGRRNPWAIAAGGAALGFVASRMLKASSSRRYEQRSTAGALPPARRTVGPGRPLAPEPPGVTGTGAGVGTGAPPVTGYDVGVGTGTGSVTGTTAPAPGTAPPPHTAPGPVGEDRFDRPSTTPLEGTP